MQAYSPRHFAVEKPKNNRLGYVDAIRFICIIFIIIGHVWGEIPLTVFVYMFMVLSGYLWRGGREIVSEAKKKFKILVYPYLGWGALLLLILLAQLVFFTSSSQKDVLLTVASVLWGGEKAKAPFTAFWYFTAIWFAGIFYRFLTGLPKVWYFLGIALSLTAGSFAGEILANLPLGIGVAFCSLVFFAAGHLLQILQEKNKTSPYISGLILLSSILIISFRLVEPMVLKSGDFGTPVLSILVYSALALAWIDVMETLYRPFEKVLQSAVSWVVALATPIILLHPIPIWFWYNVGWTGKDMGDKVPLFFICTVFAVLISVLAQKLAPPKLRKILVP